MFGCHVSLREVSHSIISLSKELYRNETKSSHFEVADPILKKKQKSRLRTTNIVQVKRCTPRFVAKLRVTPNKVMLCA